ncbi:unnamed protein product [Rotaria magnacalcarata]|uniref:Fungal lipase-type domain-containing protein n=1 Tax=Rotaria magnacalcarata TaxID=392030 RepID=A0A816VNC9_9BILA|nr:unnamed protein product [Rotaria magnacalcarata]CAF4035646.1 unnamed protein product [Rotaria magnacalcarata]
MVTEDADESVTKEQLSKSGSQYWSRCYPLSFGENICDLFKGFLLYVFSYSLCSRFIILLLILQAAVLWLGYSLNIVVQVLFIPFIYSNVNPKLTSGIFLGCNLILPGIIAFSSHYFWFVIQFGFYCYTDNETTNDNNHIDTMLCFFGKKNIYRCLITMSMVIYMICRRLMLNEDLFKTLFASLGLFPLFLMAILHVLHLISMCSFVRKSAIEGADSSISSTSTTENEDTQYFRIFVVLSVLTVAYNARQNPMFGVNVLCYIIIGLLFSIYILLFIKTPTEIIHTGEHDTCRCSYNQSIPTNLSIYELFDSKVRWIFRKTTQISLSLKENEQFHTYKLFIMIILHVMLLSFDPILTYLYHEKNRYIMFFLNKIPILLWLPPVFNEKSNRSIVNFQMSLVAVLLVFMNLISAAVAVLLLFLNSLSNRMQQLFLVAILIYAVAFLNYYWRYWTQYSSPSLALKRWIKSHESTGIYIQAFSIVFIILSLIGCLGFSFACSIYVESLHDQTNSELYQTKLFKRYDMSSDNEKQQYKMQACYWNFNGFDIQDMALFASLAYLPTRELKSELKRFYPNNQCLFVDQFHNYKEYGHGEITYYTLDTSKAVIVTIRGTTLSYEWLIDFDTWTESAISQVVSVLFPWSRLYPRGVHKIMVEKMALFDDFLTYKLPQSSKRFYVKQMIKILQQISDKYNSKPLILVGHSLGGGLAQLAGVAMNNTVAIVSISGPGISYSRAKYSETKDILMETIDARVFNIIHDRDIVPWADPQVGLVQKITCPKEYSRLQCHYVNPILCNLLKSCGNQKNFQLSEEFCRP